jgi:hypothetical protein
MTRSGKGLQCGFWHWGDGFPDPAGTVDPAQRDRAHTGRTGLPAQQAETNRRTNGSTRRGACCAA